MFKIYILYTRDKYTKNQLNKTKNRAEIFKQFSLLLLPPPAKVKINQNSTKNQTVIKYQRDIKNKTHPINTSTKQILINKEKVTNGLKQLYQQQF